LVVSAWSSVEFSMVFLHDFNGACSMWNRWKISWYITFSGIDKPSSSDDDIEYICFMVWFYGDTTSSSWWTLNFRE
jgi:hypothetical protein